MEGEIVGRDTVLLNCIVRRGGRLCMEETAGTDAISRFFVNFYRLSV